MTGPLDRIFRRKKPTKWQKVISLGSLDLTITMTTNRQAKRLILRIDEATGGVRVTLPRGVREAEALAFVRAKQNWILHRLEKSATRQSFEDGMSIPYRGRALMLQATGKARGGIVREGDVLHVSGQAEHLNRRVTDWLKAEARREITHLVREKTTAADLEHGRITIRDTKSRWGSCAINGNLNFSWRLILAPDFVLDYVTAHEVAHLAHHDHSPQFWAKVDTLTAHADQGRAWLKAFGNDLYRYG